MIAWLRKLCQDILRALISLGAYLRKHWRAVLAGVVIVLLGFIVRDGYLHWVLGWGWIEWAGEVGPGGKTWWDWLGLLVIPVVLALGAFGLQWSERNGDRRIAQERFEQEQKLANQRREDDKRIAEDQQKENALQAYIDNMTELLLDMNHPLRMSKKNDEVRVVARTRTLATLQRLDSKRKGMLLRFLYEAQLVSYSHETGIVDDGIEVDITIDPIIDLSGADLSGADLIKTFMVRVNFQHADMRGARLCGSYFSFANLFEVKLNGADLSGTNLSGANLIGTNLTGANLRGANLKGSELGGAELKGADLTYATMPDGKKYHPAIHPFAKSQPANQD